MAERRGDPLALWARFLVSDKGILSDTRPYLRTNLPLHSVSVSNAKNVLRQFALGEIPRPNEARTALALRGRWGVGKTHIWKDVVAEVRAKSKDRKYAYVSLFGLDSLDAVRGALATALAVDWVPEGRWRKSGRLVPKATGPLKTLVKDVPYLRTIAEAGGALAGAFAFELVRGALVCLDDLERSAISPKEVFGLVAHLRDERACDVIVIVNEEQLEGVAAEEFAAHGEKAIDLQLTLEPTSEEAFEVAFGAWTERRDLVRECCLRLEAANVRVLYRVRATLEALLPRIEHLDEPLVENAIRGAVLLTWAKSAPEGEAPPFERVREPSAHVYPALKKKEERTAEEQALLDLKSRYDYSPDDQLDQATAHYVDKGWFDEDALHKTIQELEKDEAVNTSRRRVRAAWSLYHNSFDDNEDELVTTLFSVHAEEAARLAPWNMDPAIRLLRDLERDDLADELIEVYANTHEGNGEVLNWRETLIGEDGPQDEAFIERLDHLASLIEDDRTLAEVLGELALKNGWDHSASDFLASRPVEEYEAYFSSVGDRYLLRRAVETCLRFGQFRDASAEYLQIAQSATEALQRIGKTSRLNRMRVERKFGIKVGGETEEEGANHE